MTPEASPQRRKRAPKTRAGKIGLAIALALAGLAVLLGLALWFLIACPWGLFQAQPSGLTGAPPKVGDGTPSFIRENVVYEYNDAVVNLLVLGVDRGNGDPNDLLAGQADGIVLLSLNTRTSQLHVLQIPRDTFVPVPLYNMLGEYLYAIDGPICTAYAYGDGDTTSGRMMADVVSELLGGIPIHRFAAVDIEAVTWLTDTLGGVPVYEYGAFEGYWALPQDGGPIVLHGELAEIYIRARSLPGMEGGDANRMARLRDYMRSAAGIVRENIEANPFYALKLYRSAREYIRFSTDLSLREMLYFGSRALAAERQMVQLAGETQICETGQAEVEFVPDEADLRAYIEAVYFVAKP